MWSVECQRWMRARAHGEVVISGVILWFLHHSANLPTFFPELSPALETLGDRLIPFNFTTTLGDQRIKEWSRLQKFWLWDSLLSFPLFWALVFL